MENEEQNKEKRQRSGKLQILRNLNDFLMSQGKYMIYDKGLLHEGIHFKGNLDPYLEILERTGIIEIVINKTGKFKRTFVRVIKDTKEEFN